MNQRCKPARPPRDLAVASQSIAAPRLTRHTRIGSGGFAKKPVEAAASGVARSVFHFSELFERTLTAEERIRCQTYGSPPIFIRGTGTSFGIAIVRSNTH